MYLHVEKKSGRVKSRRGPQSDEASRMAVQRLETWLRREQERRQIQGVDGRVDAVIESGGACTRYSYDGSGNLVEILEANGRGRRYTYDEQHRLTQAVHPDGTATSYRYGDEDQLAEVNDRGTVTRYDYDDCNRLFRISEGRTGVVIYRYDKSGRVSVARTSRVSTAYGYDAEGRMVETRQSVDGVTLTLRLDYDPHGRLEALHLPGSSCPIRYAWDHKGRPAAVRVGEKNIAAFSYRRNETRTVLGNGVSVETRSNPEDGRPASQVVTRGEQVLFEQHLEFNSLGEVVSDGQYRYGYDRLGRLSEARECSTGRCLRYTHDSMDNRVSLEVDPGGEENGESPEQGGWSSGPAVSGAGAKRGLVTRRYRYDAQGRLAAIDADAEDPMKLVHDRHGRLTQKIEAGKSRVYRYDDGGRLIEANCEGRRVGSFLYDHKGRLVLAEYEQRTERYLYGPSDELLAVTDAHGRPLRLMVWTPPGCVAEVHGALESGPVFYLHSDARGATRLYTDESGEVVARFSFDPFGLPTASAGATPCPREPAIIGASRTQSPGGEAANFRPHLGRHVWHAEVGLYCCRARWYDPDLGRFMTPDTFTGGPDDARIVNPIIPPSRQAFTRSQLLGGWLKQPRLRNNVVFCCNDPIGRVDPDGHWSFGGVLLTLLGVVWTLPNTLIGLFLEITCLVGEVIRWIVWLVSIGNVSWQTPGFDAAASGRLNAFALVFEGGWLGSLPLLGITFGNVFFVTKTWREHPTTGGPGDVFPRAYEGRVAIPRNKALYEHELRHTNQYGWFGPIFFLVYLIDWMVSGFSYCDMWLERDARKHAGL